MQLIFVSSKSPQGGYSQKKELVTLGGNPLLRFMLSTRLCQGLKNPMFARLYAAQTINLVGDALTWLGLALLAFELAGAQAGLIRTSLRCAFCLESSVVGTGLSPGRLVG